MTVFLLVAGLVLLVAGGELLVRGASGLGRALGVSPLVVGATLVATATSAPELAVSVDATLSGSPGLAVGNAVGSNTVNILLVLAVAALIRPQSGARTLLRFDLPVALGLAVLLLVLGLDDELGRLDGALLVVGLVGYLALSVVRGRRADSGAATTEEAPRRPLRDGVSVLVGVGLLVLGARWLVDSASEIAASLGLSDLVIGLTVVAIGTAMPEITTAVVAALKGDTQLAVGNVVGSNVANLGLVLGVPALLVPGGIAVDPAAVRFDVPVMIAATLALAVVLYTGSRVSRSEGAVLLAWFVAYTAYLVLDSADHDAVGPFSLVLLWFCLPVTVVGAAGFAVREARTVG
ncbi:calcium/sodium antiporter [Modestobacter sp. Leaf380]|uniref:calcium/sodium antiporter n=1 Tax=Modestobacter sp. Leaf380 TaxID=1736356 RepID=UPI0006F48827|nr:calcium/sodium antiporter [Modestobacter sp. Leaf380]KQS68723.1 sodium:calcium antiporter [Modestobacter sp. Leaf380]